MQYYIEIKPELTREQEEMLNEMEIEVWIHSVHLDVWVAHSLERLGLLKFKRENNSTYFKRLLFKRVKVSKVQKQCFEDMTKKGPVWLNEFSISPKRNYSKATLEALHKKGLIEKVPRGYNVYEYRIPQTVANMGIADIGNVSILKANSLNIPIGVFIYQENERWGLMARNYQPIRHHTIIDNAYHLEADSKEKLLWVVRKYIAPLYRNCLMNLQSFGECNWESWEEVERKKRTLGE